ncbi:MAG TPA: hypothetical protein VK485_04625 [Sphingomicrobium sp.]|nr:hypothetical protein [Sphingomicrobium sp.]
MRQRTFVKYCSGFGEVIMSAHPKKIACNIEINEGSILLLFNDIDAEIVRSWRNGKKAGDIVEKRDPLSG